MGVQYPLPCSRSHKKIVYYSPMLHSGLDAPHPSSRLHDYNCTSRVWYERPIYGRNWVTLFYLPFSHAILWKQIAHQALIRRDWHHMSRQSCQWLTWNHSSWHHRDQTDVMNQRRIEWDMSPEYMRGEDTQRYDQRWKNILHTSY